MRLKLFLFTFLLLTGCATVQLQPIDEQSSILDKYLQAYNSGDSEALREIFASDLRSMVGDRDLIEVYEELVFPNDYELTANPLKIGQGYVMADMHLRNDEAELSGWLLIIHEDDQIQALYWGEHIPSQDPRNLAAVGQAADVGSTALAISGGAIEANPVMSGVLDTGGFPLMIAIKLGMVEMYKNRDYPTCMEGLTATSQSGFGLAGANVASMLTGAIAPAIMVGIFAAVATQDSAQASAEAVCLNETINRLEKMREYNG